MAAIFVSTAWSVDPTLEDSAAGPPPYRFVDVTKQVGLDQVVRTWGSAWTDFESDGDPDLFLVRHWREPQLLLRDGDSFGALPTPRDLRGTKMDRHQCAWGEANHDGRPDLFCTQGAHRGTGRGPNQLLINKGDTLKDKAKRYGVTYARGRGRTANWVDYDRDGDLDLFYGSTTRRGFPMELFRRGRERFRKARVGLSRELSVLSSSWADWDGDRDSDLLITQHRPLPTLAYENRGRHGFKRVRLQGITERVWASAGWGDFNADGWIDLQMVGRESLRIFRNAGGRLRPVFKTHLREGRSGSWLDIDNDGDLDSFVVQGAPGNYEKPGAVNARELLLIRRRGRFERITGKSFLGPRDGNGEVATTADYDRDGRVDVFVTNGLHHWKGPLQLLRNRSLAGSWAGIDIVGSPKNPLAYGAAIQWTIGDRVLRRQLTDEVVFKGQSEVGYVHLGLAGASSTRFRIRWPQGGTDCVVAPAGVVTTVTKGTSDC